MNLTMTTPHATHCPVEPRAFTDLADELLSYLTGLDAVIDYTCVDMIVELPRVAGAGSGRSTWKVNGTLLVTAGSR